MILTLMIILFFVLATWTELRELKQSIYEEEEMMTSDGYPLMQDENVQNVMLKRPGIDITEKWVNHFQQHPELNPYESGNKLVMYNHIKETIKTEDKGNEKEIEKIKSETALDCVQWLIEYIEYRREKARIN